MPRRVKKRIHAVDVFDSEYIMICITEIPSVEKNSKKIYLGKPIWDELISEYYNKKNDTFGILFQQYTAIYVNKIYLPSLIEEWKSNTYK